MAATARGASPDSTLTVTPWPVEVANGLFRFLAQFLGKHEKRGRLGGSRDPVPVQRGGGAGEQQDAHPFRLMQGDGRRDAGGQLSADDAGRAEQPGAVPGEREHRSTYARRRTVPAP